MVAKIKACRIEIVLRRIISVEDVPAEVLNCTRARWSARVHRLDQSLHGCRHLTRRDWKLSCNGRLLVDVQLRAHQIVGHGKWRRRDWWAICRIERWAWPLAVHFVGWGQRIGGTLRVLMRAAKIVHVLVVSRRTWQKRFIGRIVKVFCFLAHAILARIL